MHLPTIQLYEDFVTHIEVKDDTVAGIVIILIRILSDGTGPDLVREDEKKNRPTTL